MHLKLFFPIILLLQVTACEFIVSDEGGFRSSDSEYMTLLKAELVKEELVFSQDEDGLIRYKKKDQMLFDSVKESTDKKLKQMVSVKFDEQYQHDYLLKLLDERSLEYIVYRRGDGYWIKWLPANKEQDKELMLEVVEYSFSIQQKQTGSKCKKNEYLHSDSSIEASNIDPNQC